MNEDRSKEWIKAVLQLIVEVINGVGDNERVVCDLVGNLTRRYLENLLEKISLQQKKATR
ncbi:hypothetical protein KQI85_03045 [Falcatimonas sp. MSJ-15]|uniref:hypothetical protein n=1 Tax=Falcatimonas sp. MSJ-15 TaxID=2841515 RepID=UPI001C0FB334|nr:hypothetical protein [Falcatimonas sp. MSJ-15]MBU5469350.1 hypothetical protein [Falcatimonas sp. MSJ-15]